MNKPTQRRLAAIVSADVVGYSRLMGVDEVGTLAVLRAHRAGLIDAKIAEHGGRIVKTMGDGLLMEFPSVVDATSCAIELQLGMAARNVGVDEDKCITFRIGVNLGDVIIEGEDILGDGVNIAARIEALAEPGGVAISDRVHEDVRDRLDVAFLDIGEQNLKNIARPVRIWHWSLAPPNEDLATRHRNFSPSAAGARLSIVVLPIVNLSGDTDQDYFAEALGDDLTSDLSRVSGSFVVARGTAATYRGLTVDPKIVSQELNVRYVLEGNLRKSGPTFRVSMGLTDGHTGQQIWTERYEKPTSDMYRFQDEVTGRIARTLNLELKEAVSRQVARGALGNIEAADLAIRAWAELWTKPQTPSTNEAALEFANQALDIDSSNAEANASLAYVYARAAMYGWGIPRNIAIRKGIKSGEKSLEVDPKCADAVYALALLNFAAGENFTAQEMLERCLDINRNHAPAYFLSGSLCLRLGQPQDTILAIERAFALSPRDPLRAVWHAMKARAHFFLDDHHLAIQEARKGIAANRDHAHNYAVLAASMAALDRVEEAEKAGKGFERALPGITVDQYISDITSDDPLARASYEPLKIGLLKVGLPK
jgi:class 3 adenylate cyclase/TolB-like protein